MFPNFLPNFLSKPVRLIAKLHGHLGPISCLAFSPDGRYLASGTRDGIQLWNMKTKQLLKVPRQALPERAQISALCWLNQTKEGHHVVCYGNGMGFLVLVECRPDEQDCKIIFSSRVANGEEIICITATLLHPGFTRIALGTRDRCIQLWNFDEANRSLTSLHSKSYRQESGIIPKALAFEDNRERDLYVFGLYDGGLYRYDGKTAKSISRHQLGSQIGNAVVDLGERICVVDNVINGFDSYQIDSGAFIQEYKNRDATRTHPKGVVFGRGCTLVIGGSDHGKVYVFDRKSGNLLQTLSHGQDGGVETVATNDGDDGRVCVASASSTALPSDTNPIHVWDLKMGKGSSTSRLWRTIESIDGLARATIYVAAVVWVFHQTQLQIAAKIQGWLWA